MNFMTAKNKSRTVSRKELIQLFSESLGCEYTQAELAFDRMSEVIKSCIVSGKSVKFPDFVILKPTTRCATRGHNPRNGSKVDIPETKSVSVRPVKSFKNLLNLKVKSRKKR
jgi:nucleoid DNA-binding protein